MLYTTCHWPCLFARQLGWQDPSSLRFDRRGLGTCVADEKLPLMELSTNADPPHPSERMNLASYYQSEAVDTDCIIVHNFTVGAQA